MSDLPKRDGLKLKGSASITGGSCCPACGGLWPSDDVLLCPHCHAQRQVSSAPIRPPSYGRGFMAALFSFIGAIARFVLFMVVIAVLAVGGTLAYRHAEPMVAGARSFLGLTPVPAPVAEIQKCATCAGGGMVDGPVINTPCDQCGGSGQYQHKLKRTSAKCPFCRGTGVKESHRDRVTCSTCGGSGLKPKDSPPE